MDINDIRLANIERLASSYRYGKEFCSAAGIDPSYLSQLRSRAKILGSDLARRIEARLELDRGALDVLRDTQRTAPSHAATAIAHAIESLNPGVKQAVAALVFELAKQEMAPPAPAQAAATAPSPAAPVSPTFDLTIPLPNDQQQQPQSEQQGPSVPRRAQS
jgi:hypothetical protein